MLTAKELRQLVQEVVPEPYRPAASKARKHGPWPLLTDVHYAKDETIDGLLRRYLPDRGPNERIQALCLNWGILSRDAGDPDWEKRLKSHTIMLREHLDVSVLGLTFIILHEVGHIHWKNAPEERLKWKIDNEELFADMYAHDRIEELHGIETAMELIVKYGSAQGFQAFARQGKECPI